VPVLCVGETIEQREAGETDAVVLRQLRAGLATLPAASRAGVIIAYEPVWAIGTGRTATPQDASAAHAAIRTELRTLVGPAGASTPATPPRCSRRATSTDFSSAARAWIPRAGRRSAPPAPDVPVLVP
jgi:hypothetical protein